MVMTCNLATQERGPETRGPMFDIDIDRAIVEDFWRSLILIGRNLGQSNTTHESARATALDLSQRFQERNKATAALMPPEQAEIFLKMIDEEDRNCLEEHQRDPDALYRRLTLELTSTPSVPPSISSQRRVLGRWLFEPWFARHYGNWSSHCSGAARESGDAGRREINACRIGQVTAGSGVF